MKCTACLGGEPVLTDGEIADFSKQVQSWSVVEKEKGIKVIQRTFRFKDFVGALAFTNTLGELAESEGHHPAILTEWGKVTVTWWTHKIKGLHKNDFIMAAKTDRLYVQ
jgi:4a-hydroxytetrahydrobiopterin dehydratase